MSGDRPSNWLDWLLRRGGSDRRLPDPTHTRRFTPFRTASFATIAHWTRLRLASRSQVGVADMTGREG